MIFSSVNENNEPAWFMVLNGKKTVTRRLKPKKIGSILSVQPKRGKKGYCKIRVLKCDKEAYLGHGLNKVQRRNEAKKEGFGSWVGLENWFIKKYGSISFTLYRIEFEVIGEKF